MTARLLLALAFLSGVNASSPAAVKGSRHEVDTRNRAAEESANVLDPKREPTTFRGLGWGTTESDLELLLGLDKYSCQDMTVFRSGERWCGSDFDMGDVRATSNFVYVQGKLVQVFLSYDPSQYGFVRSVFVAKYGSPSATTIVPTRTRAGVEYDNDTTIWDFPNVVIEMHKYGSTIERGAAYLTTKSWIADKKRKEAESKKKALDSF
jgi:hypothetical protein